MLSPTQGGGTSTIDRETAGDTARRHARGGGESNTELEFELYIRLAYDTELDLHLQLHVQQLDIFKPDFQLKSIHSIYPPAFPNSIIHRTRIPRPPFHPSTFFAAVLDRERK